jgi:quercetin dioxygenase-like cupin family protein
MTVTKMLLKSSAISLADTIEYPQTGVRRKILLEDANCQYALMSLAAETAIAEHTSPRNATVNVIEGQGLLTLEDQEIALEAGVFAFIPAKARHAVKAVTNLAFLLTLSESNLMENTFFNQVFRDSEGKIVLAQMPNLPLIVWIVASLLKILLTTGKINIGLDVLAFGSLFTWAWEELFQGVNYFRRALGFLVLFGLIVSKIQLSWSF